MCTKNPRPRMLRAAAIAAVMSMTLAACGSSDTDETTTTVGETESSTGDTAVDTTAGVEAAQWSDNVEITFGDGTFTFLSDSIPNHELPDQYLIPSGQPGGDDPGFVPTDTDTLIPAVELRHEITLHPVYAEQPTDIPLGQGAVIISGAELYNDFEDMERSVVALDDQTLVDGVGFLDACNGHPLASGLSYHYHGIPYCVSDEVDVDGEHSTVIGFMLDGFPVYANQDEGGEIITSAELDECNGHFGPTPEFPDGIYHYHLTDDAAPYSINCYHGEIEVSNTGPGGGGGGQGGPPADGERAAPDFSEAAATLGVDEDALVAALGRPPFDLEAAAEALGVSATDLEAALPVPPGGGGGGEPAQDEDAAAVDVELDADELADRTSVAESAQWADNVTITIDGNSMMFASDGLPSHEYLDVYLGDGPDGKFIAGGVESYDAQFEIPIVPTIGDAPTSTGNGAIGVAISGAVFFNPYEGDGSGTVANDDNSTIDGIPFIDACGGHPLPNATQYHYHGIPFCVTDAVDTPGEHSTLIGYLLDGHAIYGPQDVDGEEPNDLDECMGHVGPTPEFDGDTYHYHVSSQANYISECFAGVPTTTGGRGR